MVEESNFFKGNNNDNLFYIDKERQHAFDTSNNDSDTVYSWVNYKLDDNIENLTLYDSFYDENNILIPFEYDDKKEYGHRFLYRYDNCQGNSSVVVERNGKLQTITEDCGIVAVKNLLIMAEKISEDPESSLPCLFYEQETDRYYYIINNPNNPYETINIYVNSGFDETETEIINKALSLHLTNNNGDTVDLQRMSLLLSYGIANFYISPNDNFIEQITQYIKKGQGVILNSSFHSVAIISVVVDSSDKCLGFYVANLNNNISFININDIRKDYWKLAIVTTFPILKNRNVAIEGTGNELDNEITGNDGNNILKGESGTDTINGNKGDDIIIGDSTTLTNEELQELKNKNQEINIVNFETANDGNDYLDGGEGEDLLIGGGRNDILVGGKDEDSLYGGSGNDLLIAGGTSKTQAELQNIINNNGSVSITDFESDNSQNTLYGGMGDDLLVGDQGNDTMYGGGDDDTIYGGKGNDTIYGDDENNVYEGNDVIYGGDGNDTIYGGKGDDVIVAGSSPITPEAIRSLAENNNLIANNFMSYEKFENKLYGGEDSDVIIGDSGNDIIHGDGGKDYLYGGDGDDTIYGDDDDDYLNGGEGNDKLYGGEGNDTYSFAENDGNDTIIDSDGQGKILADGI